MAHKKGVGSSKNGRESHSKRLGVKIFGGQAASSILGGQGAGNVLSKITGWLAAIFIGLAILISIMSGPNEDSSSSLVKKAAEENPIPIEQNSPQLEEKQPVLDLE